MNPRSESTLGSGDEPIPFRLTPLAVATRALRSEKYAADVLAELGLKARLGNEPGEVGVIVFPAGQPAYFDTGAEPDEEVHPSGNAEATLPRITERHADGAVTELHPAPPATWAIFRALLAERFAAAERTVALHLERGIYEPRTAEAVLHDVACALGSHDEELIHELFPAVAERADAKAEKSEPEPRDERTALDQLEREEGGA